MRDGKESDLKLLQEFDSRQVERELNLLGMGYSKLKHRQALNEASGYFIGRYKIGKSVLELDKTGKMSIFRFECYLYSRLLVLLLSTQVETRLRRVAEKDFELSEWKARSYLKNE
ncbi:hypothetical protein [Adhaeribacter radiodurans]|uniref:Uncharacterized protein n=1 Tax=Adhaeribacter radiodurans TaxID=2745197 RepID=A0A7L7L4S3_9BACT|nr:hypothetical protein [Adhaeribacter radiodurans]QMU27780.1 hypothetical protein HUW48_06850 [Adhaeribacter radiodurans]